MGEGECADSLNHEMFRRTNAFVSLAVILATALPVSTMALPSDRAKVGTLTCDISAGISQIMTSQKNLTCLFTPSQPGSREVYSATINKFGLEPGATTGGEMIWAVYATGKRRFGALAGYYDDASTVATIGASLGANVLMGGLDRTVTLQPVSMQEQSDLNLAAGVTGIDLRPAR